MEAEEVMEDQSKAQVPERRPEPAPANGYRNAFAKRHLAGIPESFWGELLGDDPGHWPYEVAEIRRRWLLAEKDPVSIPNTKPPEAEKPADAKPADKMPGDTRGFPARPKKSNGDYEKDPWGDEWFPHERRRQGGRKM